MTIITAHFDGKFIVPDEPVELPIGEPLRISCEAAAGIPLRFAGLLDLAADLPGAPADMAAQHDHYLYGSSKR
jgi:hypothetical protein